jgi:hypothetical protein
MEAQSGQEQEKVMSFGLGKRPVFWRQMRSMTPLDKRPWSSSTRDSIAPAQSWQIEPQASLATGATLMLIW